VKTRIAFLGISLTVGFAALSAFAAQPIIWQSGPATLATETPGRAARTLVELSQANAEGDYAVVQFDAPLSRSQRQSLRAAGVELQDYLGSNAYFARVMPSVNADAIGDMSTLIAAAPIEMDWKLHPDLLEGKVQSWTIVHDPDQSDTQYFDPENPLEIDREPADARPLTVGAYVLFHRDVPLDVAESLVIAYGASVRSQIRSLNGLVLELPYEEIMPLASESIVRYIEPPLPQFSGLNNSNRGLVGAEQAQAAPYNLDGSGVRVMVYDGGTISASHPDLTPRVRIGDGGGVSDHATHVAGTIGGTGAASSGLYRGMAPAVEYDSYEFDTGGPLSAGFLYTDPGDLEADYNDAINNYGTDITNNSIGSNVARNGFPCDWEGNYGVTSALIDAVVRGSLGAPHRIVWAAGNERSGGQCGSTYNTTAPPSGAKNHLSIGALNSNNDTVTSFTSWGPTDDGRLKPDFCAPGCQTTDDQGVTSTGSSGGYNVKCGTSMATPTVTGLSALLLQDYRVQYPGDPDPRNSTLKTLFAHTAVDLETVGPDYRSGYGSVRIVPAIDLMRSGNWIEDVVDQSGTVEVLVIVNPGVPELKVTLAWDDAPGTPLVSPSLVNDLDLKVFGPDLTRYYPWTLDPANPGNAAVQTVEDHLNNIEQVVVNAPMPGAYLVQITGTAVPEGPQPFSLTATPLLIQCTPRGLVSHDRPKYACDGTMLISVNDCDLNTDPNAIESVTVTVASDTNPNGLLLTLYETAPQTALFTNTLNLSLAGDPNTLLITAGDTITTTYIDADDGFGGMNVTVTQTSVVDCTPPVVSNVQTVDIDPRSARVTFDTNELANGRVLYGTSCAALTEEVVSFVYVTSHSFSISGLTDNTTYYFAIEVMDEAGNVTLDDNGGACYSFATPEIPDFYTEQFLSGIDLDNSALLFLPNASVDFYEACTFSTLVLPTDPTGGTILPMGDTGFAEINLSGGNQVLLYGASYSTVFVNANGNITFLAGDTDSTETYEDHFAVPRVSALFDDLDPSEGGSISYKELADRIVVTWMNIPEDNGGNSNTFQIEMYYDGRIQIAWTNIDAIDGLAGLSLGGGSIPIDFFPSDLSSYANCGPRPPSAAGRTVVLGEGRPATITLLASDDGLPVVPGMISYIVTSLPTYELRDAGDDHVIVPGDLPYTLVAGGNEVIYTPNAGFVGTDSFTFQADDGGTPPDGGLSNLATVILEVDPVLDLPFFDNFPKNIFDTALWSVISGATVDSVNSIDPPSAPYTANLNGTPSGQDELGSHLIDLTPYSDVIVRYYWQRTGNGESPDAGDNLWVEYADANGDWQQLQQYAGDGPDNVTFNVAQHTLPPAALHDSFRLRFRSRGTSGTGNFDDWFVDDVLITVAGTPIASSKQVTVAQSGQRLIELDASDPNGDPLDFIITSVPSNGTLTDPNVGLIQSGDLPYTLVAGGRDVLYMPTTGYLGSDSFDFYATDGALDSNPASIAIVVEPVLGIPVFEPFASQTIDPDVWAIIDGVTVDDLGDGEPSPPYSARFNASPGAGDTLTSYAIDLAGLANVRFQYYWQRTGGGESPDPGEDMVVEYYNNTGTWVEWARYAGDGPDMTTYQFEDAVLPADAYHADFRVRFINSSASSGVFDDWFIDDIYIFSEEAPTAFDQSLGLAKYEWRDLTLASTDPGALPLTTTIESLPNSGILRDRGTMSIILPGDLPYAIAGGANVVRYIPDPGFSGADGFTFSVHNGLFPSNLATVSITVGGTLPIYSFPMDTDPGWTSEGSWEFGVPQGIDFDPTSGYTGQNVYGYNLAGAYEPGLPATFLTTTALDCSGVSNTQLEFQRWLGVEDSLFDQARIQISNNGSTWDDVWVHSGGNINDLSWTLQSYDISAAADDQATVYLRWSMGPTDGSAQFSGWNIDDVNILGNRVAAVGDIDNDGDLDAEDLRILMSLIPTLEGELAYNANADIDGDGMVSGEDFLLWTRTYRDELGDPDAPIGPTGLGDGNADNNVNGDDFLGLGDCLFGPENSAGSSCLDAYDVEGDGDVDSADVHWFGLLMPR
jgi:hypothetical protein